MRLLGKKIVIVGGNGYVGNFFGSRLIRQSAQVTSISRKGPKYDHPQNKNITWAQGNIMSPQPVLEHLNNADVIIHTLGVLVDTHVRKGTPKGGDGTYEQVNRDSFASLLNSLSSKKKVIYLSSNYHPPFLQRYLTTKHEAENLLFDSIHEGYAIRPGFIYNWNHRKWSIPLKYGVSIWNKMYPSIQALTSPNTTLSNLVRQFRLRENTQLQEMGDAIVKLCESGYSKNKIENSDIHQLSIQYRGSKRN